MISTNFCGDADDLFSFCFSSSCSHQSGWCGIRPRIFLSEIVEETLLSLLLRGIIRFLEKALPKWLKFSSFRTSPPSAGGYLKCGPKLKLIFAWGPNKETAGV